MNLFKNNFKKIFVILILSTLFSPHLLATSIEGKLVTTFSLLDEFQQGSIYSERTVEYCQDHKGLFEQKVSDIVNHVNNYLSDDLNKPDKITLEIEFAAVNATARGENRIRAPYYFFLSKFFQDNCRKLVKSHSDFNDVISEIDRLREERKVVTVDDKFFQRLLTHEYGHLIFIHNFKHPYKDFLFNDNEDERFLFLQRNLMNLSQTLDTLGNILANGKFNLASRREISSLITGEFLREEAFEILSEENKRKVMNLQNQMMKDYAPIKARKKELNLMLIALLHKKYQIGILSAYSEFFADAIQILVDSKDFRGFFFTGDEEGYKKSTYEKSTDVKYRNINNPNLKTPTELDNWFFDLKQESFDPHMFFAKALGALYQYVYLGMTIGEKQNLILAIMNGINKSFEEFLQESDPVSNSTLNWGIDEDNKDIVFELNERLIDAIAEEYKSPPEVGYHTPKK